MNQTPFKDQAHKERYKKVLEELGQIAYVKKDVVDRMIAEADQAMTEDLLSEQI